MAIHGLVPHPLDAEARTKNAEIPATILISHTLDVIARAHLVGHGHIAHRAGGGTIWRASDLRAAVDPQPDGPNGTARAGLERSRARDDVHAGRRHGDPARVAPRGRDNEDEKR